MEDNKLNISSRHPIRVVSRRTGLKPDRIRAWERRYGAICPDRTETGRRLYSDNDIDRLVLLERLIAAGWRISDIARLDRERLSELIISERRMAFEGREDGNGNERDGELRSYRREALEATLELNRERLQTILRDAMLSLTPIQFRGRMLLPLLNDIGSLWRSGGMRIAHEHFASVIVRMFIDTMRHPVRGESRPGLLVATPAGQFHEFGALMAAAAAEEIGWEAHYLGSNLPAEEIAAAAAVLDVKAVAVSTIYKDSEQTLIDDLRAIRRLVHSKIPLLIGGRAASDFADPIGEIGWVYLGAFEELQSYLDQIVAGPGKTP